MRAPPPGRRARQRSDEDLPRSGGCTQTRCLDHGVSKVVVTLSCHLAAAHTHPQAHRRGRRTVVDFDGLLHGDGALQAGRGEMGDGHEPVTEVLDLRSPCRGYRSAQEREVRPSQIVCLRWGHPGRQRGGANHVGEQHRHMLGVSHHVPFAATVVPGRQKRTRRAAAE